MSSTEAVPTGYEAVLRRVAIRRFPRGTVLVRGQDRVEFLHNMLSHDVKELPLLGGRYATFLTPQGRMISDLYFYKLPESVLIDLPYERRGPFLEALGRFIIMDEVELEDCSERFGRWSFQGPRAEGLVRELWGEELPQHPLSCRLGEGLLCLIRKDELGQPGFELVWPRAQQAQWESRVQELGPRYGLEELSEEAYYLLRLEQGIPLFGIDMGPENYPMEARLQEAISLTKGCYVGQEVVAKATHVGGVNRLLMGLLVEGEQVPPQGAEVLDGEGKSLGRVTSAGRSPRLERTLALAYLRRRGCRPGTRCSVRISPDTFREATVVERFEPFPAEAL